MRDIRDLTKEIVGKAKHFHPDEHMPESEPFGQCPKCGSPIVERFKSFTCTNEECDFTIWKTIAGRLLSREEFETLVSDKQVGPLTGFRSRKGKRFAAVLKLGDDFKAEFDFGRNGQTDGVTQSVDFSGQEPAFLVLTNKKDVGFEFEKREAKAKRDRKPKEPVAKIDFTGKESLGKCPKCGGKIFETENSYICERSQADRKPCKFKLSKTILGREIPIEQAKRLLTTGKTDLLDGFISKRGRPFSAYLKLEDGKVGFEFPEKTAPAESK